MAPHDRSAADRPPADHRTGPDDVEGTVDRAVTTVKHSIDQVADKVKGLLRSGR